MEYIYLSMFLQAVGKEVNEINIQDVFNVLNLKIENDKLKFFIPALSILKSENSKDIKDLTKIIEPQKIQIPLQKYRILKENSCSKVVKEKPREEQKEELPISNKNDIVNIKPAIEEQPISNKNNIVDIKPARYVYGIADKGTFQSLGNIGIDAAEVYTIPCRDMCIVVHDCIAEAYQSDDDDVVKEWLFTQQEVLDVVVEKFGVVIPMSFDMIIEGKNGNSPEEEVIAWLEKSYDSFYEKILKFRNKQEYGVQIMVDTELLSGKLIETDEELKNKRKSIDTKPQGIAYMEKELLKDLIKEKMEEMADQYFKEFYDMIKKCADDIVIGKSKIVEGNKKMIMNLSCLVNVDKVKELGEVLENIEKDDVISVRFSGPWAPFSFVTAEKG